MRFRSEGRVIVYIDETYINASHCIPKTWYGPNGEGIKAPLSRGRRWIIVHAGSAEGFVNDGLLIFKSGSQSGDYHNDMNHTNFITWVRNKLLPNLPPRTVVVCDNAAYHNVRSEASITSAARKAEMLSWLSSHNVQHDSSHTKPQLYNLIRLKKSQVCLININSFFTA